MLKKNSASARWLPKVPHKSNYQPKGPCSAPCTTRRAYITWCDQPRICLKRANITYVNEAPECTKFPAYITWATETPRKCNKLVHIVWKAPPKNLEKSVEVTWADCPETKKKVEICWMNECPKPVVKTKDVHVTLLTKQTDGCRKRAVLQKAPSDGTTKVLPRTTTIRVYCTR